MPLSLQAPVFVTLNLAANTPSSDKVLALFDFRACIRSFDLIGTSPISTAPRREWVEQFSSGRSSGRTLSERPFIKIKRIHPPKGCGRWTHKVSLPSSSSLLSWLGADTVRRSCVCPEWTRLPDVGSATGCFSFEPLILKSFERKELSRRRGVFISVSGFRWLQMAELHIASPLS